MHDIFDDPYLDDEDEEDYSDYFNKIRTIADGYTVAENKQEWLFVQT